MSNPHPIAHPSVMSKNLDSVVRARNKCNTATRRTCTVLYCIAERVFCQIPDVGAQVHTLGLRGAQQKCSGQPRAVHHKRSRIGNSEILACNVFCRSYKNLKMIRLIG